jgi:hypothetical protein
MAAPPPVQPSTPRWRPNLTPKEKELRAISADRKLATKVARRAKRQILKRMSKEERAAYDAHLLKLGKVGEWAPEHHEEQKKQRKKEDRLISKRERARDKRLIRESKRARAYEQRRRKRAINRVKNDIKRTSRNQKMWPKVHADAAFAVALFSRNGGLTEERLRPVWNATSRRWRGTSTPSSRCCYGDDVARNLISTQVEVGLCGLAEGARADVEGQALRAQRAAAAADREKRKATRYGGGDPLARGRRCRS